MVDQPEISVVIPTRDRRQLLESRALRSALDQESVDHEVVVVDDGSADDTTAFLSSLGDRRVKVVRREESGGMAAARNAGIDAARGEWLAFLDDDDVWSPRKLRVQLDAAQAGNADFVYAGAVAVDERGMVLETLFLPRPEELAEKLDLACVMPAGCSNVIARTGLIRLLGGFDEAFTHIADWDLWIRLTVAGRPAVCDEVLVAYLLHDRNIHVLDDPSAEIDALILKHASANRPRQIAPDLLGYSRWVASQRSRAGLHRAAAHAYLRGAIRHRSPGNLLRALDALFAKPSSLHRRLRSRKHCGQPSVTHPDWLRRYAT
jgi:glycosyltransferase involved in cell wall biosynthesis